LNGGGLGSALVVSYVGFTTFEMGVAASGKALENGSFTCKMEEGVIVIDLPDYKNVPPPPPPPAISDDGEELFFVVEDLPKYPGGIYDLAKYVAENQENYLSKRKLREKYWLVSLSMKR
jgi:hypothetical protein